MSSFTAITNGGTLSGWVVGDGQPVLLLHGGPGLRYSYLEPLIAELQTDFRVAIFQQRGLEPSTLVGPFTIAQAIEDVARVLDALGWSRALLVGHSWGGHLAYRFAAAHPERLLAMLAVDEVASALATGAVRYGVLAGAGSPFPWGQAARGSAELSPSAFLEVVPGAGHFVWYEAPGAVHAALARLSHGPAPA